MTLRILGHDYTVEDRDDLKAFGRASLSFSKIYLDPTITRAQRMSTLLHEAIEMADAQLELNMSHAAVCGVETAMYQFLTENGVDLTPLEDKVNE